VSFSSGYDQVAGSSEHGNEHSCSIKGSEFVEYLSDCQLVKKDAAPCGWFVRHALSFLHRGMWRFGSSFTSSGDRIKDYDLNTTGRASSHQQTRITSLRASVGWQQPQTNSSDLSDSMEQSPS